MVKKEEGVGKYDKYMNTAKNGSPEVNVRITFSRAGEKASNEKKEIADTQLETVYSAIKLCGMNGFKEAIYDMSCEIVEELGK